MTGQPEWAKAVTGQPEWALYNALHNLALVTGRLYESPVQWWGIVNTWPELNQTATVWGRLFPAANPGPGRVTFLLDRQQQPRILGSVPANKWPLLPPDKVWLHTVAYEEVILWHAERLRS